MKNKIISVVTIVIVLVLIGIFAIQQFQIGGLSKEVKDLKTLDQTNLKRILTNDKGESIDLLQIISNHEKYLSQVVYPILKNSTSTNK